MLKQAYHEWLTGFVSLDALDTWHARELCLLSNSVFSGIKDETTHKNVVE